MSVLVLELADLGFVREILILKNWNILDMIGYKDRSLEGKLSNKFFF